MSTQKLSALINYRDQLKRASSAQLLAELAHTVSTVEQAARLPNWNTTAVYEAAGIISSACKDLDTAISNMLASVDLQIKQVEHEYLIKSYQLYDLCDKSPQQIMHERADNYPRDMDAELETTIASLTKWNTPGLEIGPGTGLWTDHLVACDPLYLVDIEPYFLDAATLDFTPAYKRRVRKYTTTEYDLSMLPAQQIGLAVAINVFEYLPYEVIKNYLQQVYTVLRPGGSFVFTYNNCNLYGACQLVENDFKCYMTESRLRMIATGLGFIVEKHVDFYPHSTYAVLTRPGKLESNRGSQMLAKILN